MHTNLVKVEHQIQLTHIPEELIQDLDEKVKGLQIGQLVVIGVDTRAKEEACVATIDDLGGAPELDKIGLMLLITRCYQSVDLAFEFDLLVVVVGVVPLG